MFQELLPDYRKDGVVLLEVRPANPCGICNPVASDINGACFCAKLPSRYFPIPTNQLTVPTLDLMSDSQSDFD